MGKHSPAPWKLSRHPVCGFIVSTGIDDICVGTPPGWPKIPPRTKFAAEDEANARLIVAAPMLLEALKEIRKGEGTFSMDHSVHASNTINEMKEFAEVAIAKAEPPDSPPGGTS